MMHKKKQWEGIHFSFNKCTFLNILKNYNLKVYMQPKICMHEHFA